MNEHSQAYYVIKASQEKEELERKQDEMTAKIGKADSELKALNNTLLHLKARNSKFREYHLNKNASQKDQELKEALQDQFNEIGEALVQKKKMLAKLKEEFNQNEVQLKEYEEKLSQVVKEKKESDKENFQNQKEQAKFQEKQERAQKAIQKNMKTLQKKQLDNIQNTNEYSQYQLQLQENLAKTLNNIVKILVQQNQRDSEDLLQILKENDFEIGSQLSSVDINTQYSQSMSSSKFGMGSLKE